MALKLKNALKAYDRIDVAEIDCGNGWTCEIRSFGSVSKEFSKVQAQIRSKGGVKKKTTASAVYVNPDGSITASDKNPYLLGSLEADVDFFVDNILVGWSGLYDDDKQEVQFSPKVAKEIFLENGKPAEQLLHELMFASLDSGNFVAPVVTTQAEEDGKN